MKITSIFYPFIFITLYACQNTNSKRQAGSVGKNCMEQVIVADDKLGKIRNHACEKQSLNKTIEDYTLGLEQLDFTNCPNHFTLAFKEHIAAWKAIQPITTNYTTLRGEMHDLFKQIESGKDSVIFKQKVKAVWDTWYIIEATMK